MRPVAELRQPGAPPSTTTALYPSVHRTPMKRRLLPALFVFSATAFAAEAPPLFRAHGVTINVPDLAAGAKFYTEFWGFTEGERSPDGTAIALRPDDRPYTHVTLRLAPRTGHARYRRDAHSDLAIEVDDIRAVLARAAERKLPLLDDHVRIEQVGLAIAVADPWGGFVFALDPTRKPPPPARLPRIYNFGVYLPINAYARAREFWCDQLGFITQTDRYLPLDQALFSADKAWGFMLHMREGARPARGDYPGYSQPILQLATPDLDAALARLRAANAEILTPAPVRDAWGRRLAAFREPFGVPFEVLEIARE